MAGRGLLHARGHDRLASAVRVSLFRRPLMWADRSASEPARCQYACWVVAGGGRLHQKKKRRSPPPHFSRGGGPPPPGKTRPFLPRRFGGRIICTRSFANDTARPRARQK